MTKERKMTYQTEFKNFDVTTMPQISEGFEDISWCADVCPSFRNEEHNLTLWIDYADESLREFENEKRFCLTLEDYESDNESISYCSDDFDDILRQIAVYINP
jgi:hypothetical protein